jgi:hypothetical protein
MIKKYKKDFYSVDRFHGSALHGDLYTAGCEVRKNFTDESVCLTADKVRNEAVTFTNHRGC